jgi:putative phosphoesterase
LRFLVVSDIHSNLNALNQVLRDVRDFEVILCSGDIVGYGPNPIECVEVMMSQRAKCVIGNHDWAVTTGDISHLNQYAAEAIIINRRFLSPKAINWLGELPSYMKIEVENLKISVFHGSPENPMWEYISPSEAKQKAYYYFSKTGADIIILGHTHIPFIYQYNGKLLLNPGSVGQPRDGNPKASYLILEIENGKAKAQLKRVYYNIKEVASRIRKKGIPEILADRLSKGL